MDERLVAREEKNVSMVSVVQQRHKSSNQAHMINTNAPSREFVDG